MKFTPSAEVALRTGNSPTVAAIKKWLTSQTKSSETEIHRFCSYHFDAF
jgi:hypothetical protein